MTRHVQSNVAASVRQRLYDLAKASGEEFSNVLDRYCAEQLLYRLTVAGGGDAFVLKGALLFLVWSARVHRPTRDVDLLGHGESTVGKLEQTFRELCQAQVVDDGLVFDADSVRGAPIREGQEYGGVRVTLTVRLGNARIAMQVDVGFGDAITPGVEAVEFPPLLPKLSLPSARLSAYPRETVVAEKLQAMVVLGIGNSRMKDFFDLFTLARNFSFDGSILVRAVRNTFARRATSWPDAVPVALTPAFAADAAKALQWRSFLKRVVREEHELSLATAVECLRGFLLPVLAAAETGEEFRQDWTDGGDWRSQGR